MLLSVVWLRGDLYLVAVRQQMIGKPISRQRCHGLTVTRHVKLQVLLRAEYQVTAQIAGEEELTLQTIQRIGYR